MILIKIEINTEYLIDAAISFAAISACILAFIVFYLILFLSRKNKYLHLKYLYSNFLSEVIISDNQAEVEAVLEKTYVNRIFDYWLKKKFALRLLLRTMMKAKKSLAGAAADNICYIYEKKGLVNFSIAKLGSRHWHVKARAIQQLSEMNQQQMIPKIYRLTNSKNHYVRQEAQTAIVKLTGVDGLRFLNVISHPITEWHQICLLEQLPAYAEIALEKYKHWLASSNDSVITFAMSLAGKYQVYQLNDQIANFVIHDSAAVRKQACVSLLELDQPETPDLLIRHYEKADNTTRLRILDIIRQKGTEDHIPFIMQIENEENSEIQLRVREVISQFGNKNNSEL